MTERAYLLALDRVPELGPVSLRTLLGAFGSYAEIWRAPRSTLAAHLKRQQLPAFLDHRAGFDPAKSGLELDRQGIKTSTILDPDYPPLLREIHAPPSVLYYRGTLPTGLSVGVVGTRRATPYGLEVTRRIVRPLIQSGITIISGLAYGIDIAAHRAAIEAGGSTVAILASIIEVVPASHREVALQMLERGAIICEYPPGTLPQKGLYPARNRIISGLSRATVVVEAPEKSGALITAAAALDQNRDLFAVPGRVLDDTSDGPNQLLRLGAGLIRDGTDLLEALGLEATGKQRPAPTPANSEERLIIEALSSPHHFDELVAETGLPSAELGSLLTIMEVEGKLRHLGGSTYSL